MLAYWLTVVIEEEQLYCWHVLLNVNGATAECSEGSMG